MSSTNTNYIHEEFKSRLNSENISRMSALISLVMAEAQLQAGDSCFCSGTCTEHQFLLVGAGESTAIMDKVDDDVAVGGCIAVLKGIFDNAVVPHLQETIVILWRTNS